MSGLQLSRTFFSSMEVRVVVEFALHVHQNTESLGGSSKWPYLFNELEACYKAYKHLPVNTLFLIFRKSCIFCKCPLECHDIPLNSSHNNLPEDRMGVEEKPPKPSLIKVKEANAEGFVWVPAGLTGGQVCYTSYL